MGFIAIPYGQRTVAQKSVSISKTYLRPLAPSPDQYEPAGCCCGCLYGQLGITCPLRKFNSVLKSPTLKSDSGLNCFGIDVGYLGNLFFLSTTTSYHIIYCVIHTTVMYINLPCETVHDLARPSLVSLLATTQLPLDVFA